MKSREEIYKKYIKSKMKLDLLIYLIYALSFLSEEVQFFQYVITFKVFFVNTTLKNIFHKQDHGMKHPITLKVLTLICFIITFSHTQAMIFAKIGLSQDNGWIKMILQNTHDDTAIYITSIYWSIITMATVGYGDIHPVTKVEMVYVSIVSLISCGVYGYGLNSIGKILSDIQSKEEKFSRKMKILNVQMDTRNLDKQIQHTVRKYFEYLNKEEQADDEFANQMINTLPQSMKEKILFDANHKVLYSQKLFQLNFSKQFLDRLSLEMKTVKLGPEIDLFDLTHDNNLRVYFIQKGFVEVSLCAKSSKNKPTILKRGDMLGILEFLTQNRKERVAKTVNVVTLLYIDYNDFIQCIQQFQNDYEQYCMIRDKVSVYNNYNGLDQKCQICNKYTHIIKDCPFLNYQPNYEKLVQQINTSTNQERNTNYERSKFKCNVFQQIQNIQAHSRRMQSMNILQEYYDEEQEQENEGKEQIENDKKSTIQTNNVFGTFLSQKHSTYKHVDWDFQTDYSPSSNARKLSIQLQNSKSRSRTQYNQKENDPFRRENSRGKTKRISVFTPQMQAQQQILINSILQNQGYLPNNNNQTQFFPNGNQIVTQNVNPIVTFQPPHSSILIPHNPHQPRSFSNLNQILEAAELEIKNQIQKSALEALNGDSSNNVTSMSGSVSVNQAQGGVNNLGGSGHGGNVVNNTNNNNSSPFHNRSFSREYQNSNQNQNFQNSAMNTGQTQPSTAPSVTALQQMQRSQLNLNNNIFNNPALNQNIGIGTNNMMTSNNIIEMDSSRFIGTAYDRAEQIKIATNSKQTYSHSDTIGGFQYQYLTEYITLEDFDVYKNFKLYFPHNNISKIIKDFNGTIKNKSTFKSTRIRRYKKKK